MGKIILITGASSDVGLALIKKIHMDYETIIAHFNNDDSQLNALKENIGEKLKLIRADFRSEKETDTFIDRIERETGNPSQIVHLPASKGRNINFHKSDWRYVEADIHISLRSIYTITRRFIKPMTKARYGKIIFLLTSNTVTIPKFMIDYTTVKYALLGFMKALAVEYANKAVNINAVSPSMIETKFWKDVPPMMVAQSAEANPLKRNAVVDDIVPAVKFLLSDEAGYIMGQNLVISGGSVI